MEFSEIIVIIIIAFIAFVLYPFFNKEKSCAKCGKTRTEERTQRITEKEDATLPKAKSNGLTVLYKMKCQYCGYQWDEITEEEY